MLRSNELAVLFVILDRLQEDRRFQFCSCSLNNPHGTHLCNEDDLKMQMTQHSWINLEFEWHECATNSAIESVMKTNFVPCSIGSLMYFQQTTLLLVFETPLLELPFVNGSSLRAMSKHRRFRGSESFCEMVTQIFLL